MFNLDQFEGLNTQATRSAIKDQQLSWSKNMMPIGPGNMRSLWSNGSTIYTAPPGTTIVYYYCFNTNIDYIAIFLSDGRADQVNVNTLAVTHISATPGTFFNGTTPPACAQYGRGGIIIVGNVTGSSYWAWDAGTLYVPGGGSPAWLNGGTPTTMPTGLSGNAIEIYQNRVWVFENSLCTFSAPSNGAQFGSGGAGTFTSTDSFLRKTFVAARQSNGFLYTFGDSSIGVISNVQTSGSPAITTFTNNNVDPQVSTAWPGTVQSFGRGLMFANPSGVYVLFGGTAEKVSDELDGVFQNADFSHLIPSAAVATIFGIKCYCIVIDSFDPIAQNTAFQMFCWTGKRWFPATQDATVEQLATQEINSNLTAIGCDTVHLFPIFQTPSATLQKVVQSKLWGGRLGYITNKQANRIYAQAFDVTGAGVTLTMQIDAESAFAVTTLQLGSPINFVNNSGGIIQFQNNFGGNIFFQSASLSVRGRDLSAYGYLLGMTISTSAADFTLVSAGLLYQEYAPLG